MATLLLCDLCGQLCDEVIQVSGWWGKVLKPGVTRKQDRWEPVLREDCDRIQADLCHRCLHDRLSIAQLHAEPTREQQFEQYLQEHPGVSQLKAIRLCCGYTTDEVFCDRCQKECYEKHVRFRVERKHRLDSPQTAEMCEACFDLTWTSQRRQLAEAD